MYHLLVALAKFVHNSGFHKKVSPKYNHTIATFLI